MDSSEKPEERPKTAASTKEAPAEETNATTDEGKDVPTDGSSWVPLTPHAKLLSK